MLLGRFNSPSRGRQRTADVFSQYPYGLRTPLVVDCVETDEPTKYHYDPNKDFTMALNDHVSFSERRWEGLHNEFVDNVEDREPRTNQSYC